MYEGIWKNGKWIEKIFEKSEDQKSVYEPKRKHSVFESSDVQKNKSDPPKFLNSRTPNYSDKFNGSNMADKVNNNHNIIVL